jgi:hypothetical protein
MRRWIGPFGLAVQLAVSVACATASAEAAVHSTGPMVKGVVAASEARSPLAFDAAVELQGLYDEISQVDVPFLTQSEVDLFHDLLYAPDWVFVDAAGRKQTWAEFRERATRAASGPPDSLIQRIERLSLEGDGATTIVSVTTVRTVVDADGRYGRRGATHTITDTGLYRDGWVKVSEGWKLKSREQLGGSRVTVDRPDWDF